jgi:ornithine cyclodeaminase/alanine dehydrogenase-like protein (mu-crystallin family)
MIDGKILYLSRNDVASAGVSMSRIIDALHAMFREKGEGKVEMPPKPGIHTRPDAFIHAMPAYIPSLRSAGVKWVSGYPANQSRGLPYITGLLILNDDETGIPYCVMDCTWITAMRTGAATAVAARYFARPESETVGILACGVQGQSNLEALACCFPIKKVWAYDVSPAQARAYADKMAKKLGLPVTVVDTPAKAVCGMDMVVTSGPILRNPTPVIEDGWFAIGAFASLVDFDSYWKPDVLQHADVLATDDLDQMSYYKEHGYFKHIPPREKILDLGAVAAGKAARRQNAQQRIIAINLGLALDDMATAPLVYRAALDKGLGSWLEL